MLPNWSGRLARAAAAAAAAAPFPALRCGAGSRRAALSTLLDKPIIPAKVEDLKNTRFDYATKSYRYLPGFSFPAPRTLDQVVKPQLLERESPARIREIWTEYHDSRLDCVASAWGPGEYGALRERARRCPRMLYPVLKGDGKFFNLVAEWQDKYCIFTWLEDYRRDPSRAEPYLSVALFDDFLDRKQVVLVRGDFSGHLRKRDAAHILNLMRFYYFQEPKWVETFNKDPGAFDFTAFLASVPGAYARGGKGGACRCFGARARCPGWFLALSNHAANNAQQHSNSPPPAQRPQRSLTRRRGW
jgi:hypothetical protein